MLPLCVNFTIRVAGTVPGFKLFTFDGSQIFCLSAEKRVAQGLWGPLVDCKEESHFFPEKSSCEKLGVSAVILGRSGLGLR